MNDTEKKTTTEGAERPAGAAEAVTHDNTQEAAKQPEKGNVDFYKHVFKEPFEYGGATYTELAFDFAKLTGRDMVSIDNEMQMNNEYALAAEISRSFLCKMAAKAAGIGSDVIEALPLRDFNRITNAARSFLIETGY